MSLLCPDAFLAPPAIDEAVARALEEDLGRAGDVTSIATIPDGTRGAAVMVARKAGVIACRPMAAGGVRKLVRAGGPAPGRRRGGGRHGGAEGGCDRGPADGGGRVPQARSRCRDQGACAR